MKKALDKNGVVLGKIIRVDNLSEDLDKKRRPFAIVSIRKFLQLYKVPLDLEKMIKFEENVVWFDVLKEEIDTTIKIIRKKQKAKDEFYQKTEPARFLFFSNQRSEQTPKQRKRD